MKKAVEKSDVVVDHEELVSKSFHNTRLGSIDAAYDYLEKKLLSRNEDNSINQSFKIFCALMGGLLLGGYLTNTELFRTLLSRIIS